MKIKLSQLAIMIALLYGASVQAHETDYTIPLMPSVSSESDTDDAPKRRDKGKRTPPRPIYCTISESEGVSFSTLSVDEIVSFQLYGQNDQCIGTFTDADSFVYAIYSCYADVLEIRFVTTASTYRGFLNLE